MSAKTLRRIATVTLVLAALLGSSFAIGHSLMAQLAPPPTGATANVNSTHYADQPPPTRPSASPSASPSPSERDRQPQGDPDGPFGAMVTTGSSRVALTFDDGPDPQYTPQVLALLRQYRVKATFCVVGENAESNPDLVQAIVSEGHTLCNHSWNHDVSLGDRSPGTIRDDLLRTDAAIRAAAPNARVAYYRQPGGAWTSQVVSVAEELGMVPLHWAVDPVDWSMPGAAQIADTVLTQTAPGSIVLMHDAGGDRSGTVEALQYLLPELLRRFQLEALPTGTT
ncbi:polysaccharide deacetylase family protein [Micromonospora sp. DR5-3]|uniref:polysaccharide deacetylase family protein n=1 Tax=unclassified Micromonospora TaxID=2617518 RepID=UPI0011DB403E|nr:MULTISPECIES: polysaccharide deacetylase family protein [unclassified Micromonospora]MCW3812974.1 polysaccharide deacetylase family protein [Micromonospora sp. DR5-3]TYC26027.1 polysaccharide deacetylase family protein [Micromonospora sp. MP36]